jgi:polyhydroxyalkanoate synthase
MLATALACSSNKLAKILHSATFLNTMLDFSQPGEIGIFIREEIIKQLESMAKKHGYLDGIYLYNIFNLLKSKDLIWSAYINNYLEGLSPKAFDILYWNADYTNLPEKMLKFYLHNMYVNNLLVKAGSISLMRKKIDLSKVSQKSFFIAAKSDHIVPWQESYKSMLNLGGNKTFCLTASGHVAGIINPPCNNKYAYWSGDIKEDAQSWIDNSSKRQGSWWGHYLDWLTQSSESKEKSIDYGALKEIAPAPGLYCKDQ